MHWATMAPQSSALLLIGLSQPDFAITLACGIDQEDQSYGQDLQPKRAGKRQLCEHNIRIQATLIGDI